MKIILVGYMEGFGGAEKQLVLLANEMFKRNNEVLLISMHANNICYKLDENIDNKFIKDKYFSIFKLIYRYNSLKKIIKEAKPNIIINFWFQSAYMLSFMGKNITNKIIYSERGDPSDKEYNGILGILRKISFNKIDGFIFQSKGAQSYFNEKIRRKSCVIHNPVLIDPDKYEIISNPRKRIINVGRLHTQKNQELLIKSYSMLSKKSQKYILEIYGCGDLQKQLEDLIDQLKLRNKVFLKGTTSNLYDEIYDSTLFVLSSNYEGMPNVLLEAMALGIPCISTDCKPGGAREIIKDGINGSIVECNNPIKLKEKINELLNNRELREKYAIEGKKEIKNYSSKKIYDEWEKFLKMVVNNQNN